MARIRCAGASIVVDDEDAGRAHASPPLAAMLTGGLRRRGAAARRGRARRGAGAASDPPPEGLERALRRRLRAGVRRARRRRIAFAAHFFEPRGALPREQPPTLATRSFQTCARRSAALRRRGAPARAAVSTRAAGYSGAEERDDLLEQPPVAAGAATAPRARRTTDRLRGVNGDRRGAGALGVGGRRAGARPPEALDGRVAARRRRSASTGSRPCPPRDSARGRPASRAR